MGSEKGEIKCKKKKKAGGGKKRGNSPLSHEEGNGTESHDEASPAVYH